MLHTIDGNGNISWHCPNPACPYHNCQGWDREIPCLHHAEQQRNQPTGQTITAHLSDPEVQWVGENEVALPACPGCRERGVLSKTTLRVHTNEELTPPIIAKDGQTGAILQVAPHPHPKFSGNLWIVDADSIRKRQPHPTLAHLSPDQIIQMQADIKNRAPDAPTEWMMTETIQQKINAVYPHPAVARHRELADHLIASGKTYQPAPEPEPAPPQVLTLEQVREEITKALQEQGVLTTPRLPAVSAAMSALSECNAVTAEPPTTQN